MPNEISPLNEGRFEQAFHYTPVPVARKGIVVTGGTTGIGRAIAMLLVAQGVSVLIFGRHRQKLDDTLNAIKEVGGGAIYGRVADTTKPDDIARVFQDADRDLGRVDALINNAALAANSILDTEYGQ